MNLARRLDPTTWPDWLVLTLLFVVLAGLAGSIAR